MRTFRLILFGLAFLLMLTAIAWAADPVVLAKFIDHPEGNLTALANALLAAVQERNWRFLFAGAIAIMVWAARRFGGEHVPWFQSEVGGVVLVLLISLGTTFAVVLASSAPLSVAVIVEGLATALTAAGGYAMLRKLWRAYRRRRAAMAPVRMLLLFGAFGLGIAACAGSAKDGAAKDFRDRAGEAVDRAQAVFSEAIVECKVVERSAMVVLKVVWHLLAEPVTPDWAAFGRDLWRSYGAPTVTCALEVAHRMVLAQRVGEQAARGRVLPNGEREHIAEGGASGGGDAGRTAAWERIELLYQDRSWMPPAPPK